MFNGAPSKRGQGTVRVVAVALVVWLGYFSDILLFWTIWLAGFLKNDNELKIKQERQVFSSHVHVRISWFILILISPIYVLLLLNTIGLIWVLWWLSQQCHVTHIRVGLA